VFSRIRSRFTYANVVVTLALVFAMSGGAYAAGRYLITSTKQISPKVLRQLQGKVGAPGAAGAQGPAGPQGLQGPSGGAGPQGPEGLEGPAGKNGAAGKNGSSGKEGSPWTAGGTLPKGATETGTWVASRVDNAGGEIATVAVSFAIPLASAGVEVAFIKADETPPPGECKGTVEKPEALPGHLCIFEGVTAVHKEGPKEEGLNYVVALNETGGPGVGTTGTQLAFATDQPSTPGVEVSVEGTWAVTAE
jgi:hypothetical protein